jgi:hypothetical protein
MRYRNVNTGEERVTVTGSRLDKRVAADPAWAPVPLVVTVGTDLAAPIVVDDKVGLDAEDVA